MTYQRNNARIGIYFIGRLQGALGANSDYYERRTVSLPIPCTEEQARELARESLYNRQGDSPAYEHVTVKRITFN